ncbi:C-type lectin-like IEV/EEV glycoprotein [Sea otter poxvirus]|uniref:C-type lectin-like IEV/EEV glycoprotein n=1 Tax=Sea otter poxvirus TaxID=1416741 RepID=A0A2U9QHT8_9POXV|nr:C-type lectin-like IEV/EEV glycoprotein [Sea otter poxvirus]AWU47169.1 C-type lectin-like IEV/EEV glycoprotein [Sea otter poxvirus]
MVALSFNRQSKQRLKKCVNPVAACVTLVSVLSSVGAIIKYTDLLIKEACDQHWVSVDGLCYYNTYMDGNNTDARDICKKYNADIFTLLSKHYAYALYMLNLGSETVWIDTYKISTAVDADNILQVIKTATTDKTDKTNINDCATIKNIAVSSYPCNSTAKIVCIKSFS